MQIRQLIDNRSSTYTYLVWDLNSREAAIIDPVKEQVERDLKLIYELGLVLKYSLETHIHADHLTGSGLIRESLDCSIGVHLNAASECSDLKLLDGDILTLGEAKLGVIYTPGHTNTDISYLGDGAVFTGDILLIRGSGRTDFQSGDPGQSYDSITHRLFTLPDETLIYPGHDYNGFTCSTVGEEKKFNPRLGNGAKRDEYIQLMRDMKLAKPERMDCAVPGNQICGLVE
ncbi:MAG: MBL fold metallo-hydrolase [Candidatus Thiodiazotropha sp. (ex Lucinoma kastoroae)]|nr:MBL fold metallo-hydrolase [Candidatus Thiodiazotropha sp. (ex Lucinoma kastoroae)]MCU7858909.1 MBL fold metallo-hydrolase [Candidatus Thiodiazotropha sp. (ex Lucinoma kastoroae)]